MPQTSQKANRGPAAASENRAALVAAARRLFAERGFHVPLSAIAREAGVGQGSLYRHFPSRQEIGEAILDENLVALEAIDGDFGELWSAVVEQLVESGGFVETVLSSPEAARAASLGRRYVALVAAPLARARAAGAVAADLDTERLLLVTRMVLGAIHTEPDGPSRRATAHRVLALIGRGLELGKGE